MPGGHPEKEARLPPRVIPRMIQLGDSAPDVQFIDAEGRSGSLSDFWRDGPVVLVFLRHFG